MKLISKIEKVSKIIVESDDIYFQKDNVIYKNQHLLRVLDANFFGQFYINNGQLIIQSYLGKLDFNENLYDGFYNYLNTKIISYLSNINNRIHIIEQDGEYELKINKNYYQFDNKGIIIESGVLYIYSIPNCELIWHYNLKQLESYITNTNERKEYEVKHFLGVSENQLIVQLSNATLLFLDINSGEMINILNIYELLPLPIQIFYDDARPVHIEGNQLIWLNNQRLIKIDLNTFDAKVTRDYFDEPREQQFRFMSNTYQDGKLYFVADYGWHYVTPSYVGAMDASSGDVLWHQQLENTGGLPEAPQVTKDKLYVRTSSGVLYIFEKENA